jgi:hypothetical protein
MSAGRGGGDSSLKSLEPAQAATGRGFGGLRIANLVLAVLATLPPIAHVLELPNKIVLDAPLWLGIQQHLYRGWGPFFGGPVEILALVTALALLILRRHDRVPMRVTLVAAIAYAGMIATFLVFNNPVNAALNTWTPSTIPPDWGSYRLRWEVGHALAAILSGIALAALVRAWLIERDRRRLAKG